MTSPIEQVNYPFRENERRRREAWEEASIFRAPDRPDRDAKTYVLEMFPYPSGNIHMGHLRNYAIGDVIARMKKMQGHDVLHAIGWDSFGLPAENAAAERGVHPRPWTESNITNMRRQLKMLGLSYDWSREISTCDPEYYKEEQRFFLKMMEHGLAYRKEATVNWDPVDQTVLANEQVIEGRGWRSGALVEKRKLNQWFLRITAFADGLLEGLDGLTEWPDNVRLMQRNWIGRSYGARFSFELEGREDTLSVYSTRPETLFGAAFCAVAAEHPLAKEAAQRSLDAAEFIESCTRGAADEATLETEEKRGFLIPGLRAVHPFDRTRTLPVYIANFVLMEYGEGAVFGCPAHDERDFAFARRYSLPVVSVIAPAGNIPEPTDAAYTGDGVMKNSDFLNGLTVEGARDKAIGELEARGKGERSVKLRLRDWGVSRQRYWGAPIPIIHCDTCGAVPVPEADLPVRLPDDVEFTAQGGNPLVRHPTWKHVPCPVCGKPAERETDTFDTFFESSWYFLRFASPNGGDLSRDAVASWLPVDRYIGGVEHAVLHLLYARFFTRALEHMGIIPPGLKEPFKGLLTQGMVCRRTYKNADGKWVFPDDVVTGEDGALTERGTGLAVTAGRSEKMSKSKRNVADPEAIVTQYGADAARLFMLSDSPPERDLEWTEDGIEGMRRFINRLWKDAEEFAAAYPASGQEHAAPELDALKAGPALELVKELHRAVHDVTKDAEAYRLNKAVARLRESHNAARAFCPETPEDVAAKRWAFLTLTKLFSPFVPHVAESMFERLGGKGFVCSAVWPTADERALEKNEMTYAVQINGKLRDTFAASATATQEELKTIAVERPGAKRALEGLQIRKIIVVPGKVVNVVAA